MAEGTLSARMGARRRDRIAFLVLLRRVTAYNHRATAFRTGMVVLAMACALGSARTGWALLLASPAALSCILSLTHERHGRVGSSPRFWLSIAYARSLVRTDARHQLNMGSLLDIPGGCLLAAIPSWVTTDQPTWARLGGLLAAVCFLSGVAATIFNDHTWYNPEETTPPLWHEIFRKLAGVVTALPVALIALPAPWPSDAWWGVVILTLCGLTVNVRIWDTDLTLAYVTPLAREESLAGRNLVLNETHGALSTNLRLLEQQTRPYRDSDPTLHDLAVSANSRLRETLALASADLDSSTDTQTLAAPVYTLARAVGARVEVAITVRSLAPPDRQLARLVLNDLVGNALNAGASAVGVRVAREGAQLAVSVTDDAPPIRPDVWKTPGTSSARLESRLTALSGSLTVEQGSPLKVVTARWRGQDEAAEAGGGGRRDASAPR